MTHEVPARLHWMDATRGAAICLLLLWHASAVPALLGQEMPSYIRAVNEMFLPYRMPTLMFLSGVLLGKSLSKPLPIYYARKFATIAWPYVVWLLIAAIVYRGQPDLSWWHWRTWYAQSYLWFLFFIGIYYFVAPLWRRLPRWLPVMAAFLIAAALPLGGTEQRLAYYAIFFFAGHWLTAVPGLWSRLGTRRHMAFLLVPVLAFAITNALWTDTWQYNAWGSACSLAGILLLITVVSRAQRFATWKRISSPLEYMGRSSLVYYVAHYPVMILTTEALTVQAHPLLLLLANLSLAVIVGTIFVWFKGSIPIAWLFEAPRLMTSALASTLGWAPLRRRQSGRRASLPGAYDNAP